MPISSASTRIFKSEDPVMETDLQLLAKVNEFQQLKFDEGAKDLQNEINNWSMLANVAKDEDKAYINAKLNKLVGGIQQLGGVNLADANNVNSLKSLGYNMYGDENVMNPVLTTRRMQALQQDIFDKTSGKNAKDYDSVYGEYLLDSYKDWLNDGQQGTGFDGPTSLPQGNFDQYNKKINDVISKLQPDINEAPQGPADAWNYLQVGNKFIKKERIWAAIEANTSAQDQAVISAHAWKSMSGLQDNQLLDLQRKSYDSSLADLQSTYNTLKTQKSLTTQDAAQQEIFDAQIKQIEGAIAGVNAQKAQLPQLQEGQGLPDSFRQNLRDNLFFGAYKEQTANARAYEQKKVELKTNQAAVSKANYMQRAYQFGLNYNLKLQEFGLKQREADLKEQKNMIELYGMYGGNMGTMGQMGIYGPAMSAPLSIVPNMGKDDATMVNDNIITQSDANVIAKSTAFYNYGYDYLMKKDAQLYSRWMTKGEDGHWKPKDEKARKICESALNSAVDMYGNIATMSIQERNGLKFGDDELNLYAASKDVNQALIYQNQVKEMTDEVFTSAGLVPPSQQNVIIKMKSGPDKVITMAKLREMQERGDGRLEELKANAQDIDVKDIRLEEMQRRFFEKHPELRNKLRYFEPSTRGPAQTPEEKDYEKIVQDVMKEYPSQGFWKENLTWGNRNSVDVALNQMKHYYGQSEVKDGWEKLSKTFNVYARPAMLPQVKGKPNQYLQTFLGNELRKQKDIAGSVQDQDIDLRQVWTTYDINSNSPNKVRYMASVRYQTGSGMDKGANAKGDKIATVDLTDQVMSDHNNPNGGYFGSLFADDDAQVVYGLLLNNKGMTPLSSKDNYTSALQTRSSGLLAHKYQITAMKNATSGVDGYRVNVLVPKGRDASGKPQYQTMPVLNFDGLNPMSKQATPDFPANFKYVQDYMDTWFGDFDHAQEFYRRHGLEFVPQQKTETPTQQ